MKYIALFILIQVGSLGLALLGVPICGALALFRAARFDGTLWHWPRMFWIWDNAQDGVDPHWWQVAHPTWSKALREFAWTALRNPCHNFGLLPGVSGAGRPIYYRTFTVAGREFYVKAGWMGNGYPAFSAGSGKGY